jgi:hypothetical protein
MLVKGIMTQISGSLGGITGSHNSGGLYLRARTIPVNPNTGLQMIVRAAVTQLVSRWNGLLTVTQRATWTLYASNVPLPGPLGDPHLVSGLNMYVRSNVARLQVGLARVDSAPTVFDLGFFTPPVYTATGATDIVSVAFTNTDPWATAVGSALLIYIGNPQNPGVTFYAGPYRFLGRVNGAVVPPTSPATFTAPFDIAVSQRLGFFARATNLDGRYSGKIQSLVPVV